MQVILNQTRYSEYFFNQTPSYMKTLPEEFLPLTIISLLFGFSLYLLQKKSYENEKEKCNYKNEEEKCNYGDELEEKCNYEPSAPYEDELEYKNELEPELEPDVSLKERLDETEKILTEQLDMFKQMNRIEDLSKQIEEEKQKGDLNERLEIIENKQLIYIFHINDFNNFVKDVYEKVKESSRCKQRPKVMKKIGKMWKEMSNDEKMKYKFD
jgi:predicted RND superfamily exporter protein